MAILKEKRVDLFFFLVTPHLVYLLSTDDGISLSIPGWLL